MRTRKRKFPSAPFVAVYFPTRISRSARRDDSGDAEQTRYPRGACNLHFFDCTGLQHLGLEQGAGQGWGGLPRGSLPPHCLPPPPGHHPHTHPQPVGASAFNPFHHAIEQRSPRLPGSNAGKSNARASRARIKIPRRRRRQQGGRGRRRRRRGRGSTRETPDPRPPPERGRSGVFK